MDNSIITEKISEVKPLRDIIFEHLRQEILNGNFKPDDRIIERDLAEKLNVSRTPIREALRKLESEGFVEHLPRKGAIVRGFNITEIEEIYDIRKELECLAVRNAIKNITEHDVEVMKAILEQLENGEFDKQANLTSKGLNEFDELIFKTAQMPMLKNFIHILRESLMRYKKINLSDAPRRRHAIVEHKAILQAIINRDVELAERLTLEHIENARKELLKKCR